MNPCSHHIYNAFCDRCRRAAVQAPPWPMAERKFWIVWSPTGPSNPTKKHETEGEAITEAERLAKLHGGMEFYVMEAKSKSALPPTVTMKLV